MFGTLIWYESNLGSNTTGVHLESGLKKNTVAQKLSFWPWKERLTTGTCWNIKLLPSTLNINSEFLCSARNNINIDLIKSLIYYY